MAEDLSAWGDPHPTELSPPNRVGDNRCNSGFVPMPWEVQSPATAVKVPHNINCTPFLPGDVSAFGVESSLTLRVSSSGGDGDYIGVAFGYDRGDLDNPAADYFVLIWALSSDYGLRLLRVVGSPPSPTNNNWIINAPNPPAFAGVTELGQAPIGGWVHDQSYDFDIAFASNRLRVRVNGSTQFDLLASDVGVESFDGGDLALFNFSQAAAFYQDVTTTPLVCGDGFVNGSETCDDSNTADGDCCSRFCDFEAQSVECRPVAGQCDVPEFCTGSSGVCPTDINPGCSPTPTQSPTTTQTEGYIYFTGGGGTGQIARAKGPCFSPEVLVDAQPDTQGIALDLVHGKMYWANNGRTDGIPRIRRANLDGTGVESDFISTVNPSGLALDVAGNHLCWAGGSGFISCSDLNGNGVQQILLPPGDSVTGLEIDRTAGKIYWSDGDHGWIKRMNLDGSNIQTVVTGLSFPRGFVLDANANRIYVANENIADSSYSKIQKISFGSSSFSGSTTIDDLFVGGGAIGYPLDIGFDSLSQKLYWTGYIHQRIYRGGGDGSGLVALLSGLGGQIWAIDLASPIDGSLCPSPTAASSATPTNTPTSTSTQTPTQTATATPTITLTPIHTPVPCGNGITNPGEQCDDGNNQNGDCCSSTCQFEVNGTVCRAAAGDCDVAEVCSGSSMACPVDAYQPADTPCEDGSPLTCPDRCNAGGFCVAGSDESPACPNTCCDGIDNNNDDHTDLDDSGCSALRDESRFALIATSPKNKAIRMGSKVEVDSLDLLIERADCTDPYPLRTQAGVCGSSMQILSGGEVGFIATLATGKQTVQFGQGEANEQIIDIRSHWASLGFPEVIKSNAPYVGPGMCSLSGEPCSQPLETPGTCTSDSPGACCPSPELCLGRKKLDDPSNPYVYRVGTHEDYLACQTLQAKLATDAAAIALIPGNVPDYTDGTKVLRVRAAPVGTDCNVLADCTIVLGSGQQVLHAKTVQLDKGAELRICRDPLATGAPTVVVVRVAKGFKLASDSKVTACGITPDRILWNVEGTRGGGVKLLKGSSLIGTVLAPGRGPGIILGGGANIDGSLFGLKVNFKADANLHHYPFAASVQ